MAKKTNKNTPAKLNDSLESIVTKMGVRANARAYKGVYKNINELNAAFDSSWIVRRYIQKLSQDMLKNGRELYISENFTEQDKKLFFDAHVKFKTQGVIKDLLFNLFLYGEVVLLAVTDTDEANYEMPLSKNETIRRFIVLNETEYKQLKTGLKFSQSEFYSIKGIKTHESRFIRLVESVQSYGTRERKNTSTLSVALDICKMFDTITLSVSDLIEECKLDIYKIEGYNDQVTAGNDELIIKRLELAQRAKSYTNSIAMDIKDNYETKETNLAGLAELWSKASIVVAGALGLPLSVIFGESASGLNSGGEDNRRYYEIIAELQNSFLRPVFEFIDPFILKTTGKEWQILEFDFTSIDSLNDKEKAEVLNIKTTALTTLIQNSVINEAIALKELRDDGLIKNITDDDVTEAELLSKEIENEADFRAEI
ncbi:anti-CBASS protein Acb1 family protein [Campylobacter mucosalis]|uniref:anti-CBASS protein Acb1 family protein n=1 Tax=Campylobacter mucosalis TaxID=202 RepID=UPI00146FD17D|nr:anti-CBASS Acb1 family protein [Campylobacter mucosalis]